MVSGGRDGSMKLAFAWNSDPFRAGDPSPLRRPQAARVTQIASLCTDNAGGDTTGLQLAAAA